MSTKIFVLRRKTSRPQISIACSSDSATIGHSLGTRPLPTSIQAPFPELHTPFNRAAKAVNTLSCLPSALAGGHGRGDVYVGSQAPSHVWAGAPSCAPHREPSLCSAARNFRTGNAAFHRCPLSGLPACAGPGSCAGACPARSPVRLLSRVCQLALSPPSTKTTLDATFQIATGSGSCPAPSLARPTPRRLLCHPCRRIRPAGC